MSITAVNHLASCSHGEIWRLFACLPLAFLLKSKCRYARGLTRICKDQRICHLASSKARTNGKSTYQVENDQDEIML